MKSAIVFVSLLLVQSSSAAFVEFHPTTATTKVPSAAQTTRLHENRRDFVANGAAAFTSLVGIITMTQQPQRASADVDYSKIQDLLGPGGDLATYQPVPDGKRPTWLTEPTADFRESEEKALEFKRKNLLVQKQFEAILDKVTTAPNNETVLVEALDELRRLVKATGGLPTGITKDQLVKTCRRRKAKKYWPTVVEIA